MPSRFDFDCVLIGLSKLYQLKLLMHKNMLHMRQSFFGVLLLQNVLINYMYELVNIIIQYLKLKFNDTLIDINMPGYRPVLHTSLLFSLLIPHLICDVYHFICGVINLDCQ